jgi:hypothetical protein
MHFFILSYFHLLFFFDLSSDYEFDSFDLTGSVQS